MTNRDVKTLAVTFTCHSEGIFLTSEAAIFHCFLSEVVRQGTAGKGAKDKVTARKAFLSSK